VEEISRAVVLGVVSVLKEWGTSW